MLIDRPNVREGSYIQNARIAYGTSYPSNPDVGELFFRTDLGSLLAYNGGTWVEAGAVALAAHAADVGLHLTSAQNTFLDGLSAGLTATELNYVDGVTSPIQTQLNTLGTQISTEVTDRTNAISSLQGQITSGSSALSSHAGDYTLHLTSAQNTFLDSLSVTSTEVNYLSGVTSSVQTQFNAANTALSTHAADYTLHLTSAQNTFLDGLSGVVSADVNALSGMSAFLVAAGSASTSAYLSSLNNGKVSKAGDTISGNLVMTSGAKITGLPLPSLDTDAASKAYVDALAGGIDWKQAVDVATTGSITLSGLQTIDGVSVTAGMRVLVKDQATPAQNGIYVASAGAWSRAADYDTALEASQAAVYVLAGGTSNGRGSFLQTNNVTTLGTDPLNFTAFSGPVVNTAGNGISLGVNGTVSVKNGAGINFDGGSNVIAAVYSGGGLFTTTDGTTSSTAAGAGLSLTKVGTAGTYRSVTTDSFGRVTAGTNPTTLSGYGITDAQPLNAYLTAISGLSGTGIQVKTGASTVNIRSIDVSGVGLTVSNGDGVAGNPTVISNATAANTASAIVSRDASGNFSAGTITASLNGNATSASSVPFSGITSLPSTLLYDKGTASTGADWNTYTTAGIYQVISTGSWSGTNVPSSAYQYGTLMVTVSQTNVVSQLYITHSVTEIWMRSKYNASDWTTWQRVITSTNYTSYSPTLTGSGASGTWGISITGNAATAGTASSATLATKASTLAQGGGTGAAMTFSYSGQGGQPTWLWGTNDGTTVQVYNPSNFSVATAANASNTSSISNAVGGAYSWTGTQSFITSSSVGTAGSMGTLWAYSTNGATTAAGMSFHRSGAYAINMGLDADGVFRLGGWSDGANTYRMQVSLSGLSSAGGFYPNNGSNYLRTVTGSYGGLEIVGTTGGWAGLSINTSGGGTVIGMYDASGNGGTWDATSGWQLYWNRTNTCLGLGGSNTTSGYRAQTNGSHYVGGNLYATGDVTAFSDRRIKKDVALIENALEKTLALNGVIYTRIDTEERQIGFIAQDMQEVLPEVVKKTGDGDYLGVTYGNVNALLVEAIKELTAEVRALKSEIDQLKAR